MAYTNGTITDLSQLLTALTNACVAGGWTYAGGELTKHGCIFPISVDTYSSPYTRLRMQIKSPDDSALSEITSIRQMSNVVISFPAEYHIFTFDKEVYCVLNIHPGTYASISFGVTSISVPGSGAFLSGSCSATTTTNFEANCPAFFFKGSYAASSTAHAHSIDTGFSYPTRFRTSNSVYSEELGATIWYAGLHGVGYSQPNNYSGESILTPLRIFAEYSADKYCLVYESVNARHLRIDNYEDEQIIIYGTDKWMVFPWTKRNDSDRNNVNKYSDLISGTYGWAIRYEGP